MFLDEYFSFDLLLLFFFSLKEYLPSIYLVLREIHFFRMKKIMWNDLALNYYFQNDVALNVSR